MTADTPRLCRFAVTDELIDELGHMNMTHYLDQFSRAADQRLDFTLVADAQSKPAAALVTVEAHIAYRREAMRGDALVVETWIADCDDKRVHVVQAMRRVEDGELLASCEQLFLNLDAGLRRAAPFADRIRVRLAALSSADHGSFDRAMVGRRIAVRREGRSQ